MRRRGLLILGPIRQPVYKIIYLVSRLFCQACVSEKEPSLAKKMSEAIVPVKWDTGLLFCPTKVGQNDFDCACVSVVFLFLLCFIAYSYEANGGTYLEVLACFRPDFNFSGLNISKNHLSDYLCRLATKA